MGPGVLGLREEAGPGVLGQREEDWSLTFESGLGNGRVTREERGTPGSEEGGLGPVSLAELTEPAEGLKEVIVARILGISYSVEA